MPSNHIILSLPLLLLPSIFPSIRVFSNQSALHIRWPKYWSFSFNISPSNEHSGPISPRMDWLDLLAVQGTLKSFLHHHSSKAPILQQTTSHTHVKNIFNTLASILPDFSNSNDLFLHSNSLSCLQGSCHHLEFLSHWVNQYLFRSMTAALYIARVISFKTSENSLYQWGASQGH